VKGKKQKKESGHTPCPGQGVGGKMGTKGTSPGNNTTTIANSPHKNESGGHILDGSGQAPREKTGSRKGKKLGN